MNGKKAKMCRRLARQMSVGMKDVQYHDKALNPRRPTRRTRFLHECTRLIYKNIKVSFKTKAAS